MCRRRSGHGEDLPLVELVLEFGRLLEREVLREGAPAWEVGRGGGHGQ